MVKSIPEAKIKIPDHTLDWLIDPTDPGARYLTLLLLGTRSKSEFIEAKDQSHQKDPIATVLNKMHPEGYWENDDHGYLPKYRSSAWSLILLAQLGTKADMDLRISTACRNYLDKAISAKGQISATGPPSGTVDCLQGNILAAMLDLGYSDSHLKSGFEWMARSLTDEGVARMKEKKVPLRYYSGKIGPGFKCGANNKLPCAWGASKVMLAFSKL